MRMHELTAIVIAALILAFGSSPRADTVTPLAGVTSGVTVRASASAQSAQVALLRPGDQALLLGSVPNWYQIELPGGVRGFVSKRWTQVAATDGPQPAAPATFTMDVLDVGTGLAI